MKKTLNVALWELVVFGLFSGVFGAAFNECTAKAHAEDIPSVSYNINRVACALEGIQHALERLERKK